VVAVYVLLLAALHELGSFPIDWYGSFALERSYGLATERFGHWLSGRAKASLVGLVLGVAGAAVTYVALWSCAAWWWVAAGGVFSLAAVTLTMAGPVLLLPLFHQCRPLEREPLRARLIRLAARAGVPAIGVYEWRLSDRTRKANAALAGLGATRRILVSDTLLSDYTEDEIEVILAHELAHHVHGDIWKGVASEVGLIFGGLFRRQPRAGARGAGAGADGRGGRGRPPRPAAGRAGPRCGGAARHERGLARARAPGRSLRPRPDRNPAAFTSAMRRLAFQNLAEPQPSRLTRWLFSSHPPIEQRLDMASRWSPDPRSSYFRLWWSFWPGGRSPPYGRPPASGAGEPPSASGSRALRLSRTLPVGSMLMTLTINCSPSLSSSRTSFTRCLAISETCSSPSTPGMISTKAPKSVIRWTFPR